MLYTRELALIVHAHQAATRVRQAFETVVGMVAMELFVFSVYAEHKVQLARHHASKLISG